MLLQLCKKLLTLCLPRHLIEDISGDLEEEYQLLKKEGCDKNSPNLWLIKQTIMTCTRYTCTVTNLLVAFVALFSLTLFAFMALGIIWLSSYDDPSAFSAKFWQEFNNASHIVFFEPKFWHYAPTALSEGMSFGLWIDGPALTYSIIALVFLSWLDRRMQLTAKIYSQISLPSMFLPYLWGSAKFLLYQISMVETGPLIATMWLSILYMTLPIGYVLMNKIKASYQ